MLEKNMPEGLKYNIKIKASSDINLIKSAACVLSYGSTMCFKSIQAGIPTVVFTKLGDVGNFDDYYAKVKLGEDYFDYILDHDLYEKDRKDFLRRTVTGGCENNASDLYTEAVYGVIDEWKQKSINQ
jgi:hypothetical protein